MRRLVPLVLAALAMAACGDTEGSSTTPTVGCKDASAGEVTLVADDLRWDTDCLRTPPGPLTIVVDNRDDGVNHNVHLPSAEGSPATELEEGPSQQELEVDLPPGSYEFICDLHPNMVGTLTVR
jgi:plastocyanin